MREIVCVRHQANVPLGSFQTALDDRSIPWRYLDAWTDPEWPDISSVGGVIVLGGKMSALEDDEFPFLKQTRELMQAAIDGDVPVLGSCLGAQLLAQVVGGHVYRLPQPEVGFVEVALNNEGADDPVLSHIAGLDGILSWHEDSFMLPDDATVLAGTSAVQNQAFRFGSARGIQFHIEVTEREIASWADETDPQKLRSWWGIDKEQLLEQAGRYLPAQAEAARRMVEELVSLL